MNVNTLSKTALVLVTALLLPLLLISNAGIVSPRGAVVFPSVVLPPAPKWPRTLQIDWQYPTEVIIDIEFEIWCQTNTKLGRAHWTVENDTSQNPRFKLVGDPMALTADWFLFATTTNRFLRFTADKPSALFIVRAKDKRSGKVSDWAGN